MENELAGKKAKFYRDTDTPVHIILANKRFYNGKVNYVGADFLLIEDIKLGESCLFYLEIEDISPYREKEAGDGN